ncbi:hypothetical protein HPG69_010253 [Diceros bicornis minor]|uniref:Uncharacterized protein n=1 Tax=Diceros bicornis minor TaxID=77932 RepID=A0A7J7EER1_DICBM|nr:hypothetical protein HPG69_010253 [Diceros bicornis minor]
MVHFHQNQNQENHFIISQHLQLVRILWKDSGVPRKIKLQSGTLKSTDVVVQGRAISEVDSVVQWIPLGMQILLRYTRVARQPSKTVTHQFPCILTNKETKEYMEETSEKHSGSFSKALPVHGCGTRSCSWQDSALLRMPQMLELRRKQFPFKDKTKKTSFWSSKEKKRINRK